LEVIIFSILAKKNPMLAGRQTQKTQSTFVWHDTKLHVRNKLFEIKNRSTQNWQLRLRSQTSTNI